MMMPSELDLDLKVANFKDSLSVRAESSLFSETFICLVLLFPVTKINKFEPASMQEASVNVDCWNKATFCSVQYP